MNDPANNIYQRGAKNDGNNHSLRLPQQGDLNIMMSKNIFATRRGIISVGGFIGIFGALLQKLGNPGNMGICVACFERDIAGAIAITH